VGTISEDPVPVTLKQIEENIDFWHSGYIAPSHSMPANISPSYSELKERLEAANFLNSMEFSQSKFFHAMMFVSPGGHLYVL
jgi:hypothetical protein